MQKEILNTVDILTAETGKNKNSGQKSVEKGESCSKSGPSKTPNNPPNMADPFNIDTLEQAEALLENLEVCLINQHTVQSPSQMTHTANFNMYITRAMQAPDSKCRSSWPK